MIVSKAKRLEHVEEYYFSHKLREIAQMNANGKNVINLGIGKPDLPPPASAINRLNSAALNDSSHGYQSYNGIPELRMAFSNWYKQYYQTDLNPESEILPLIGSKEGIMHITMSFLESGDEVLIPNPGYPAYSSAANLSGATTIYYNLTAENDWLPNFEELEEMDLSKVKLMWINYPHMPTGARGNIDVFVKLINFCKSNKILLCHDNPYSFILNEIPFSILSIEGAKECTLELNSLSKSHNMSGWRVGMVGGKKDYIDTIMQFKSNMDSGMFKAVQEGAIEALNIEENWYRNLFDIYTERKKEAEKIIRLLECEYIDNQSGMFLWAKINEGYNNSKELADHILYGCNVFITPGSIFGSNGDQYIRISLCQPVELIATAKERIKIFVENAAQSKFSQKVV